MGQIQVGRLQTGEVFWTKDETFPKKEPAQQTGLNFVRYHTDGHYFAVFQIIIIQKNRWDI